MIERRPGCRAQAGEPAILLRYARERLPDWLELTRPDRPVGMRPALARSGHLAREGFADLLAIFLLGVVLAGAGCVVNDYADRDFDGRRAHPRAADSDNA